MNQSGAAAFTPRPTSKSICVLLPSRRLTPASTVEAFACGRPKGVKKVKAIVQPERDDGVLLDSEPFPNCQHSPPIEGITL